MSQNTDAHRSVAVAHGDWHRLLARWSERMVAAEPSTLSFSSTAGNRWLQLTPRERAAAEADWLPFELRAGYPGSIAGSPVDAPYLLVVRVFASDADRDEFRRWLDEEHCRRQVSLPGVNWYLGYEQERAPHSFLNIWSIDEPAIAISQSWERVRDTPWWAHLSHVPANGDRDVYRRMPTSET